jgi:hypothetical protein
MSLALHDFHQRRITQSQKRYLAAIKALATVRRLLTPRLPAVMIGQMNVGQHQTNGTMLNGHQHNSGAVNDAPRHRPARVGSPDD